ncbi:MAG TPA: helix-turn-helix transcriptional regulator [Acidimicrobiales bacterium]|jgi:transcriptional regulator with XRE-family HTH domain|nr:helix-turn-helix transcriptional regulator [Acidimicrobiales bacterium]
MARRRTPSPKLWTANQIVAFNVAKARRLRGWTQEEAARALAPYLGTTLSTASFSALERSVDTGRVREFNADELLAFARGFGVPITWFFTPPSVYWDGVGVSTPDTGEEGLDPMVMLHAVLGTPETLAAYREDLLSWPDPRHRMRRNPDGTLENQGRLQEDLHPLLDDLLRLRARRQLRDRFGDVDRAREVLNALTAVLDELDDSPLEGPAADASSPTPGGKTADPSRTAKPVA